MSTGVLTLGDSQGRSVAVPSASLAGTPPGPPCHSLQIKPQRGPVTPKPPAHTPLGVSAVAGAGVLDVVILLL